MQFVGRIGHISFSHRSSSLKNRHPFWCFCLPLVGFWIARPISTTSALWIHPARTLSLKQLPQQTLSFRQQHSFVPFSTMPPSSSKRGAAAKDDNEKITAENDASAVDEESSPSPRKRARASSASPKKKAKGEVKTTKSPAKKKAGVKGAKKKAAADDDSSVSSSGSKSKSAKKKTTKKKSPAKKKASDHQRVTDRVPLEKLWNAEEAASKGSYTYRIASWNVAGLRALVKKEPNKLSEICKEYNLDMLCLQETKIQESHLDDPKLKLKECSPEADGYAGYWSCSTAKKGYSGTAIFVKQHGEAKPAKQKSIDNFFAPKKGAKGGSSKSGASGPTELPVAPEKLKEESVEYGIGKSIDNEGRVITVDLPFASIANVYVPNSGQTLQRLDYRTNEWDKDFLAYMQKKEADRKLPVIWLGDLNVAHTAHDVWNDGAKHLDKQAGVTPQERASFQEQLDAGFSDAFRKLHGSTSGQYSYWSQRAGNRAPNKGLRLDYFIASNSMFDESSSNVIVRDSYILPEVLGSDHCPVVLELEIKE